MNTFLVKINNQMIGSNRIFKFHSIEVLFFKYELIAKGVGVNEETIMMWVGFMVVFFELIATAFISLLSVLYTLMQVLHSNLFLHNSW